MSWNMKFGTYTDYEYAFKLCKKCRIYARNYKIFRRVLRLCMTGKSYKNKIKIYIKKKSFPD